MTEAETTTRGYPRHWEADVLLRDGGSAHLRPTAPTDADLLVDFYSQVSDQSKYYRFFAPMPTLSDHEVKRFVEVDHHDRVALVLTVAEKMIAIGQFERLPGSPGQGDLAEVAFLVQDRHQHRGIGQLLLEHLAQIGRELDIEKFVAEILPDNIGMLQVFREAGYQVAGGFEDGVMHMEFPIDPTTTSLDVMQAREHRAETASVQRFFAARSVAVIGASRRHDTIGRLLVRNLVLGDYQGRVYVVNPAADAVKGLPSYASVVDIPDDVDVAIIAVPAEAVPDVVLDCANKGVHGVIVVSAGFAETGEEGRRLQRQVLRLCRSYGLRLVGPTALGIINTATDSRLNASLSTVMPPRGRAGFFCQSGALGVAILENVSRRGLGLSTFVSAGNRADVSGNDLLQYWEEDESTEVVLLFLESIGNPRKFSRIARRVSRRKPVIAVKSGRTTQGVPMGHSVRASQAGPAAVDAMFRQAGVIQVNTLDEMFDVAQLLAHQPLPRGNRLAIVGNSDALGLLAADAAVAEGLEVRSVGGGLRAEATAEEFEKALDTAIDDPEVDAVLAVFIPPINIKGTEVANVLAVVGEQSDKPVLSTFLASQGVPELLRVPDVAGSSAGRGSVPSYNSPAMAVHALARAVEYAAWLDRPEGPVVAPAHADQLRARSTVNQLLASAPEGREVTDPELAELLGAYGIELWERVQVTTEEEAVAAGHRLGWGVVLKATAESMRQRPDQAHVWRNIDTEAEMRDAWQTMAAGIGDMPAASFVVQRVAPSGVPVAIHAVEDPLFGPVISLGISGFSSELLGDRAYRIPPMHALDAAEMVRDIKASPLLFGYRGSAPVDTDSLERLLLQLAQLKNDLPQVQELDLSLVIVGTHGTTVLTASAAVAPALDARSDWYARRMGGDTEETLPASRTVARPRRAADRLRDTLSRMHDVTGSYRDLRSAIEASGYYPDVVADAVFAAVAGESVEAHLVHHEPTIDERDEVRRHVTVLVLTPTRLILAHTDEHAPDDILPSPYTSTTTEAINLRAVRTVVVNRMVADPASYAGKRLPAPGASEAVLSIGWGAVNRIDIEPAACGDPNCDADHGYTGVVGSDDFSLRVSAAAEGPQAVAQLLAFAGALSGRTVGVPGAR